MSLAAPLRASGAGPLDTPLAAPVLAARGLAKRYGVVEALLDVGIDFHAGEIHALVGENGAGKSTLTRLLGGEEQPDAGQISVGGKAITLLRPGDARRAGITLVHQQFQLVDALTVAENICLEDPPLRHLGGILPLIDRREMVRRAERQLAPFNLAQKAAVKLRDLSVAERQVVEISRALARPLQLLILDEPTSALSAAETETLFAHVRRLAADGVAILFIAHSLADVLTIADRITVLRGGRLVATAAAHKLDAERLTRLMVGRDLATRHKPAGPRNGEVVLEISNGGRRVAIARGEILGIPTYIGSALRQFLERLSGARRGPAGSVTFRGAGIGRCGIASRVRRGICFVPGDTAAEGLIPKLSIEDNILLPNVPRFTRFGLIDRRAIRRAAGELIQSLDIRPVDPGVAVERLSGGNRQKVAIAKWLLAGADVLIMDDPARGVDVGAKVELYRMIAGHAEKGGSAVLASSDLDELIALSDRLIILRGETMVAELTERPFERAAILAALGSRPAGAKQGEAAQ